MLYVIFFLVLWEAGVAGNAKRVRKAVCDVWSTLLQ